MATSSAPKKVADQPYDPIWLDERDAAQAVAQIVQKGPSGQYSAIHIQSAGARARFSVANAKSHLTFAPQYNFEAKPMKSFASRRQRLSRSARG